jgi:hypothetical protein
MSCHDRDAPIVWSAIGKTGARTRAEAVRLADEAGWLL